MQCPHFAVEKWGLNGARRASGRNAFALFVCLSGALEANAVRIAPGEFFSRPSERGRDRIAAGRAGDQRAAHHAASSLGDSSCSRGSVTPVDVGQQGGEGSPAYGVTVIASPPVGLPTLQTGRVSDPGYGRNPGRRRTGCGPSGWTPSIFQPSGSALKL